MYRVSAALKRPVVGLFLNERIVSNLKKQRWAPYLRLMAMVKAGETAGTTLVVFSTGDVQFNPDTMGGVYFNWRRNRWERGDYPLPDILYDRFLEMNPVMAERAAYIRGEFEKRGVKKINARHFFDKWEIYEILARDERVSPHLPLTVLLRDTADLAGLFARFNVIYLKSTTGRRGKQVVRAAKLAGGGYSYRYFDKKLFTGEAQNLPALYRIVRSVAGERVIAQQAVDLLKIDSRIVDLRGELQRNGQGNLEIVDIPVRLGAENSPVATHGSSYRFAAFFARRPGYSRDAIAALRKKAAKFLIAVYQCMEQAYGPFGEIAIDFGIDKAGKLWFFECNAKSMKVSLYSSAKPETVDRVFLNPFLYAKHLYNSR
jgi:hypothetical protein